MEFIEATAFTKHVKSETENIPSHILRQMAKRDIGQEILEGIREIKAHKAGEKTLRTHTLKEPAPPQVIRAKLHLS